MSVVSLVLVYLQLEQVLEASLVLVFALELVFALGLVLEVPMELTFAVELGPKSKCIGCSNIRYPARKMSSERSFFKEQRCFKASSPISLLSRLRISRVFIPAKC